MLLTLQSDEFTIGDFSILYAMFYPFMLAYLPAIDSWGACLCFYACDEEYSDEGENPFNLVHDSLS
jgi:hypothetical protein